MASTKAEVGLLIENFRMLPRALIGAVGMRPSTGRPVNCSSSSGVENVWSSVSSKATTATASSDPIISAAARITIFTRRGG